MLYYKPLKAKVYLIKKQVIENYKLIILKLTTIKFEI